MAGGRPVSLRPANYRDKRNTIDGLIISGGSDICPERYGNLPKPSYIYDLPRDEMEAELVAHATEKQWPMLGICRGAQMINVVRGGTLHTNIALVYEKAEYPNGTLARIFFRKPMQAAEGTLLARLVDCQPCSVNSLHTQAVDQLGEGLIISAQEPNGVVQAIEHPHKPYFLGVQFHPEYLQHRAQDRRIFKALITEALNHG